MKMRTSVLRFVLLATALLGLASLAAAQDDPPERVARLNFMQGTVSLRPAGEEDWVEANPNRPLTAGDSLWVGGGGRGELHTGSTAIRLGSETQISFLALNDRTTQVQLSQGTLYVRMMRMEPGDALEVDTPNVAFSAVRPGVYRVEVSPDGERTVVTVRWGEGEVTGGGSTYTVTQGQRATFRGGENLAYENGAAAGPDGFEDWCQSRDEREDHISVSVRYVPRDLVGYDDLDDYGDWQPATEYGAVWFPRRVVVGWAPYRYGHWVWIEPWGWTWVEDEPWGFAPFHYGRWAIIEGRWGWVPGPLVVRPVYAPALVVFVGGGGFSLEAFGPGGGIAWFPLGPREVYVPAYHCSPRYVEQINVTNTIVERTYVRNVYNNYTSNRVTNITYMHQNNVRAITAVSRDTFVNARPVAQAAVHVDEHHLQGAQVQRLAPVSPEKKSVIGQGTPVPGNARPPAGVANRQVVSHLPPPPPPISYQRKQPLYSSGTPGRPPEPHELERMRTPQEHNPPTVKPAPPVRANENTFRGGRPEEKRPQPPPQPPKQPKKGPGAEGR